MATKFFICILLALVTCPSYITRVHGAVPSLQKLVPSALQGPEDILKNYCQAYLTQTAVLLLRQMGSNRADNVQAFQTDVGYTSLTRQQEEIS